MEASTTPAAPAATEAPIEQQPTAQPETPQPAVPEQTGEAQTSEGGVMEAINGLREQIQTLSTQQQPADEPAVDLLTALTEGDGEEEPQGEQAPEFGGQPQPEFQDPEAQAQMDALQQFVDDRAREIVQPWMRQQQAKEVNALATEFPDIKSDAVLPDLERFVDQMIEQTGNPDLAWNADFVRNAYFLVKARQAESNAVPAEQVADNGASIETNAGQTQTGTPSENEQIIQEYFGSPQSASLFTQ